ncbi:hypothetical protein [Streptomyces sp. NPDC048192]|uniref:hypothetical protein n=1 Tax=Streptomyces sp. NPDC048192 TaxID=3365510 RepID=UPI0037181322
MAGGLAGADVGTEYGAEAGVVIGSAVPGAGTAAGAVVGGLVRGVAGSGIGEGIAERIEVLVEMKSWLARLFGKERPRSAGENSAAVSPAVPVWIDPGIPDEERAVLLVRLIEDPSAREDEQDDAASDLEYLSGPFVEAALIRTIRAGDFSSDLAQRCAESLAGIWAREGRVEPAFLEELRSLAKEKVFGILGARAPHLLPPGAHQGSSGGSRSESGPDRGEGPPVS